MVEHGGGDALRRGAVDRPSASATFEKTSAMSCGQSRGLAASSRARHVRAAARDQDRDARSLSHGGSPTRRHVCVHVPGPPATVQPFSPGSIRPMAKAVSPASPSALDHRLDLRRARDDRHHADPAVEGAGHLARLDVALGLEEPTNTGGSGQRRRRSGHADRRAARAGIFSNSPPPVIWARALILPVAGPAASSAGRRSASAPAGPSPGSRSGRTAPVPIAARPRSATIRRTSEIAVGMNARGGDAQDRHRPSATRCAISASPRSTAPTAKPARS